MMKFIIQHHIIIIRTDIYFKNHTSIQHSSSIHAKAIRKKRIKIGEKGEKKRKEEDEA